MAFSDKIKELAKQNIKTIVLPESNDVRTLEATVKILEEKIAKVILIGNKEEVQKTTEIDLTNVKFIDVNNYERKQEMIDLFVELRKAKGMTNELAIKTLENPLYFGAMLVKMDVVDGMVAGAINTTGDVLRPALQIVKTAPDADMVSSFMIMDVPNCEYGEKGLLAFGDCALTQNPDSKQLASIAIDTAKSFKAFTGVDPFVGMLSHSTMGSAKHADVDKVVEATKLAKEKAPQLAIDGELQLDAAIVPSVGNQKAPDSEVAGRANVVIFPDLDAANIGYKLVQRFSKADAYGPIIQGLAKPINDLSRGCSSDDIVAVVAFTSVQAGM